MAELIDRLTTVWDADFKDLDQALKQIPRQVNATADKIERRLNETGDKLARNLNRSSVQAFDKMATGAERGSQSVLGALGGIDKAALGAAAGVAVATAALAALTGAITGAREAASFAAELTNTAKSVHLTTDALQEYRFALAQAGGEEEKADDALKNFSVNLGKAQQGIDSAMRSFQALGFTEAQVQSFKSTDEALRAVVQRISELGKTGQQDAIIKAFGLDALAPLIANGTAEMDRLRKKAHEVGVVMDAELVKRGAELDEQFETVARVIDIQLKSALVDIGPVLLYLLGLVADLAKAAASVVDTFRSIENKTLAGLKDQSADLKRRANSPTSFLFGGRRADLERAAKVDAEIARREAAAAAPPPAARGTRELIDTSRRSGGGGRSKRGRTIRDTTEQRTDQVNALLNDAERDLLQAWSQLTLGAEAQAAIQKQILDVESEVLNARLDAQKREIMADEGLSAAKKAELAANLEIVRTEQGKVDALKRELIDRETSDQLAKQRVDVQQAELDGQQELLQLQEGLAETQAQRRDLQLKLLDLADQQVRLEAEAVLASQTATDAQKELARLRLAQLESSRGLREEGVRQGTMGPLEDYFSSLPDTVDKVNERMQNLATDGISSVVDGLAGVAAGFTSFGDVAKRVLAQLTYDLTKLNLERMLASATSGGGGGGGGGNIFGTLLSLFGGSGGGGSRASVLSSLSGLYASGTDSARGGWSMVGEKGPEILNIPRGAQVIPNDILRSLAKGRGTTPSQAASTFNVSIYGHSGSAADARRTGRQVAAAAQREMALTRRAGIG